MKYSANPNWVRTWRGQAPIGTTMVHSQYRTHSFPPHEHEEFTLGFIEQGVQAYSVEGKKKVMIPSGTICPINPGQVHSGDPGIEAGWSQRVIFITPANLAHCVKDTLDCEHLSDLHFKDCVLFDKQVLAALYKAHITSESSDLTSLEKGTYLVEALKLLTTRYAGARQSKHLQPILPNAIKRAREYIDEHYGNNPSLEEIAAIAELSPYHLLRVFKSFIGIAPHAYLIQRRVESVRSQIIKGRPLKVIADATGYSDQAHLSREFRRFYGVPPSKFARYDQH